MARVILEFCWSQLLSHNGLQAGSFGLMRSWVVFEKIKHYYTFDFNFCFDGNEGRNSDSLKSVVAIGMVASQVRRGSGTPGFSTARQVAFVLLHFLCSQVNEVIFGKVGFPYRRLCQKGTDYRFAFHLKIVWAEVTLRSILRAFGSLRFSGCRETEKASLSLSIPACRSICFSDEKSKFPPSKLLLQVGRLDQKSLSHCSVCFFSRTRLAIPGPRAERFTSFSLTKIICLIHQAVSKLLPVELPGERAYLFYFSSQNHT